ncbi:MAG: hypothetical protein AB1813_09970 [Verrucomicrobiota bacterium]
MRIPARMTRPTLFEIRNRGTDGQVRRDQEQVIELTFHATPLFS